VRPYFFDRDRRTTMGKNRYRRTVVYEIEADSMEDADEIWDMDGPEIATAGGVSVFDTSDIEPAPGEGAE